MSTSSAAKSSTLTASTPGAALFARTFSHASNTRRFSNLKRLQLLPRSICRLLPRTVDPHTTLNCPAPSPRTPLQGPHRYYEPVRPRAPHRYSPTHSVRCLRFSPSQPKTPAVSIAATGSPVPCQRLRRAHATHTPGTTGATYSQLPDRGPTAASLCPRTTHRSQFQCHRYFVSMRQQRFTHVRLLIAHPVGAGNPVVADQAACRYSLTSPSHRVDFASSRCVCCWFGGSAGCGGRWASCLVSAYDRIFGHPQALRTATAASTAINPRSASDGRRENQLAIILSRSVTVRGTFNATTFRR